ncbi:MAG: hypothetical protein ABI624_17310 [Casimicrobiaceae bacterium]
MAAIVACGIERASAQAPPAIPVAPLPAKAPEFTVRSVLFDTKGAEAARARQQPLYVESIVVEGRDPDGRRPPRKPLEQRFAEALLAPPPSSAMGMRPLDTTPCMSLQSTWNTIGNSYAPASGCP